MTTPLQIETLLRKYLGSSCTVLAIISSIACSLVFALSPSDLATYAKARIAISNEPAGIKEASIPTQVGKATTSYFNNDPAATAKLSVNPIPNWGATGELIATAIDADSVELSWSGATDDRAILGYRVFDKEGNLLADTPTTSWTATGLNDYDLYSFTVQAYDDKGFQSTNGPSFGGQFPFDKVIAPAPQNGELYGGSVSIDGDTAIITGLHADVLVNGVLRNQAGRAYIYSRKGVIWQLETELTASDGNTNAAFGYDTALSGDRAIVGAWHSDEDGLPDTGSAYIFARVSGEWIEETRLASPIPQRDAEFGVSVAIQGDIAVVGAHEEDFNALAKVGAVYVYERDVSGNWNEVAVLHPSDADTGQAFGRSVAIDGNLIVVGAPKSDYSGAINGGALYIFEQSDTGWKQQAKLVSDDIADADLLGEDVAIEQTTVVTVARDDDLGLQSGSGYVFEFDGSTWRQTGKLLDPDGSPGDRLGFRATIKNGLVGLGSYRKKIGSANKAGAAHLFQKNAGEWSHIAQFDAGTDASENDNYGISIALTGDTLLIGSERDDLSGTETDYFLSVPSGISFPTGDSGSAWFYNTDFGTGDNTEPEWLDAEIRLISTDISSLKVSWNGATDDNAIDSYQVSINGALFETVTEKETLITGLMQDTEYSISVEAVDLVGNVSTTGPVLMATTGIDNEEVDLASSCLAGLGRVDLNIVNNQTASSVYRFELESQSARQVSVANGEWRRIRITGRPAASYSAVVKRDGHTVLSKILNINCDSISPTVSTPEITVLNSCRTNNGYVIFQFVNPTASIRPYIIEFEGVPNRSTSAAPFGQAIRATSGRPDGTYHYLVRSAGEVLVADSLTVDCD